MKLREIAVAVAALFVAGTTVAAGDYSKGQQAASSAQQAATTGQGSTSPMDQKSGASSMGQRDQHAGAPMGHHGNMRVGQSDSSLVRQAQQMLSQKGHNPGPVDGILGPQTQKALRDYQQAQGLPASGQLDQQTLSSLGVQGQGSAQGQASTETSSPSASGTARTGATAEGGLPGRSAADASTSAAGTSSPSSTATTGAATSSPAADTSSNSTSASSPSSPATSSGSPPATSSTSSPPSPTDKSGTPAK